jgi:hypothetical protein
MHGIAQAKGGEVTNAEYQKALASANFDKAVTSKKLDPVKAAEMKREMKMTPAEKRAAKRKRDEEAGEVPEEQKVDLRTKV